MSRKVSLYISVRNRLAAEQVCAALACESTIADCGGKIAINARFDDRLADTFRIVARARFHGMDTETLFSVFIRSRARQIQEAIIEGTGIDIEPEQRDIDTEIDVLRTCRMMAEGRTSAAGVFLRDRGA
jgi:hypothetical protein